MNIFQSLFLALKGLAAAKMRALLTMLGIIIGVGAVIIIVSLGNGMSQMLKEQFAAMGSNLIQVNVMGRGSSRSISPEQMFQLAADNPDDIVAVSPSVSMNASVKYGTDTYSPTITGVSEDYLTIRNLELVAGRFLSYLDMETRQKTCVIGSYLNQTMFYGMGEGQTLYINGSAFTVVGILAERADSTEYSDDDMLLMPYPTAMRMSGNGTVSSYVLSAAGEDKTESARTIVETKLAEVFGDSSTAYRVTAMSEMLANIDEIQSQTYYILAAIAAISLVVGGIGIMNIMLVSVSERTREIGIRKSLGAKGRDILSQFIIEAMTTSAIGGALGIGAGIGLSGVVGQLMDMTAVPSVSAVALSAGVSVAVGVVFGYLPASKAAKLNPIDALRYD